MILSKKQLSSLDRRGVDVPRTLRSNHREPFSGPPSIHAKAYARAELKAGNDAGPAHRHERPFATAAALQTMTERKI
jgi:hypothetical protein